MKITASLLVLVSIALCGSRFAAAQTAANPVASKIVALENEWTAAYERHDVESMASFLADDFIITVEDGNTYSKSGYIAHTGDSSVHIELAKMSDLTVRMHGKTAVVTGAYHEKGNSKGKPYEYRDRFTDVWMDINGKWQVVASHYSIPAKQ